MQIYGWELLVACHHLDKSRDRYHCDDGDLKFLVCHVTSRKFMGGSFSRSVTLSPCLVAIGQVQVEIKSIQYFT